MKYAQTTEDGSEATQITTDGNVEWDATHFCPVSALTADEAALFRVVPLLEIERPPFDPITQTCLRDGCEQVLGSWQYKWTISELSEEQITENKCAQQNEALGNLANTYKADLVSLQLSWLSATISGGPTEASKKAAIQADMNDAKAQYLLDVAEIKARYL